MLKKKLKISTKTFVYYGIILSLFLATVLSFYLRLNKTINSSEKIAYLNYLSSHITQKQVDHLKWVAELNKTLLDNNSTSVDIQMDHHKCDFGQWYYGNERSKAEETVPELKDILTRIEQPHINLHHTAEEISNLFKVGNRSEIINQARLIYQNKTLPELSKINTIIEEIESVYKEKIKLEEQLIKKEIAQTKVFILSISILTLLLATLLSLLSTKSIVKPLGVFQELFFKLSRGELNAKYNINNVNCSEVMGCGKEECPDYGKDGVLCYFDVGSFAPEFGKEIHCPKILKGVYKSCEECKVYDLIANNEIDSLGAWLNKYTDITKDMIMSIREGAFNVADASNQTSVAAQQLSQNASKQASALEEVSSSMQQMVSNIESNADNARQTSSITNEATEGISIVGKTSEQSLESVNKISEKINIINDISFQTNILALNAAVEAARAGEYGKGFAVVASEVRKLAENSKVAANEIVEVSQTSKSVTEEVNSIIENLVPNIKEITTLINEISEASLEQNSGANEINSAVQSLNNSTQQNASASEELASSSERLAEQANQLKEIVSYFKFN